MPIHESSKMQQILQDQVFMDLRNIAVFDMKQAPTCYHGPNGGSCIDYILSTPCLYDSFSQFEVCKVQPFKDHGLVSVKLLVPAPVQTRLCLKKPVSLPTLQSPCAGQGLLKCMTLTATSSKNCSLDKSMKLTVCSLMKWTDCCMKFPKFKVMTYPQTEFVVAR